MEQINAKRSEADLQWPVPSCYGPLTDTLSQFAIAAQKPEVRAAARQAALAAGKEKKKAAETKKASDKVGICSIDRHSSAHFRTQPKGPSASAPKLGRNQMKAGGKR
jgi:hypothetical protein